VEKNLKRSTEVKLTNLTIFDASSGIDLIRKKNYETVKQVKDHSEATKFCGTWLAVKIYTASTEATWSDRVLGIFKRN
jgi:hypothetical protein